MWDDATLFLKNSRLLSGMDKIPARFKLHIHYRCCWVICQVFRCKLYFLITRKYTIKNKSQETKRKGEELPKILD